MRLLHYNIHGWRDANGVDNVERVADLIKNHDPDVVSLVEVDEPWGRPGALERVAAHLGYHWVFVPTFEYRQQGGFGNALLSRTPFRAVQQWQLLPPRLYDGTEPSEPRSLLLARLDVDGDVRSVATTHLPRESEPERQLASGRVLELVSAIKEPWIVCGDFNQPASAWLNDRQAFAPNAVATYPAHAPVAAIDYCIFDHLDVDVEVLDEPDPSDHLPIVIEARLGTG